MNNPPRASLLGLPVELRLSIFEYALLDTTVKIHNRKDICQGGVRNPWAYLQLNRQIRSEILPTFLESVKFELLDGLGTLEFEAWLECIGAEAVAKIKKMEFNCRGRCTMFGLQPDTDYCHRTITLDLTTYHPPNDVQLKQAGLRALQHEYGARICSNGAISCSDELDARAFNQIWHETDPSAFRRTQQQKSDGTVEGELVKDFLVRIYRVLETDLSTSAA